MSRSWFQWGVSRRTLLVGEGGFCCQQQASTAWKLTRFAYPKGRGRKTKWPREPPGRCGYCGQKVRNVGVVLGSTHIPRRRGSLVFAASDLDIRHLWLSRSRYGREYKR